MKKVLIVEDDKDISLLLKNHLEDNQFSVDIVEDGYAALGYLRSASAPDIIILDLVLPGRSGLDLLCSFKSKWTETKIFIFSGHEKYKEKLHLYKDNICGFYCKPDEVTKLIDAIKKE